MSRRYQRARNGERRANGASRDDLIGGLNHSGKAAGWYCRQSVF